MPGICSCTIARTTVPINCRYHCSSIIRAITDLRPETMASARHFGTMYLGRCCADDWGATDWSSRQPAGSRRRVFNSPFGSRLIIELRERDADPVLFPPYDAAMPARLIGLHDQREFLGNSRSIWDIKGGAGL